MTTEPPEPVEQDTLEDLELDDAEDVMGGRLASPPPPGGPLPIPYPNVHE